MRILLPPSETKHPGGGKSSLALDEFRETALNDARVQVLTALQVLSADRETALRVLKLSEKQSKLLETNDTLFSAPTMPAIERYTGVLFDALSVETLEGQARAWLDDAVFVQSAAFGRISATDLIPSYRLSASSLLPGLSIAGKAATLKQFWQSAHELVDARRELTTGQEFTLDLRSKDYVSLAPIDRSACVGMWVNVVSRGEDGVVRALNHFNKAAKGRLARLLAITRPTVSSATDFLDWARANQVECVQDSDEQLTVVAESVRLEAGQIDLGNTQRNS